jgi:hypothetical protein
VGWELVYIPPLLMIQEVWERRKGDNITAALSYSQGALRTQRSTNIRAGSQCKGITLLQDFLSVAAFLRQIQFAFGFGGE